MNDKRLFAQHPPGLTFCPSEPSAEARESISAWTSLHGTCQCGCAACAEGRANSLADPCGGRHHLHKHDAHFPLERDRGFVRERSQDLVRGSAALFIRSIQARRRAYASSNAPNSMRAFALATPRGASAIWKMSRPARGRKVWRASNRATCPPAISASSFIAHDETSMHIRLRHERHGHNDPSKMT